MRRLLLCSCVLVIGNAAAAQTVEEKKATVAFVNRLHLSTGGYTIAGAKGDNAKKASMAATSTAARALPKFGGALVDPKLDAAFVESCFDAKTGAFADTPGGPGNVHLTAVGLMAVVEMKLPRDKYQPAAAYLTARCESFEEIRIGAAAFEALQTAPPKKDAWLAKVLADRKTTGIWGEGRGVARATGSAAALVLRLQSPLLRQPTVLQAMNDGQRADGGFGMPDRDDSDLDSTYRVMRAFHMLRESPADARRVRLFVHKCRNADGGYGLRPGEPSTLSGVYFAGTILGWLNQTGNPTELDKTRPSN